VESVQNGTKFKEKTQSIALICESKKQENSLDNQEKNGINSYLGNERDKFSSLL
jgi:hypothetical protein